MTNRDPVHLTLNSDLELVEAEDLQRDDVARFPYPLRLAVILVVGIVLGFVLRGIG
jgi:hypothetical protein